MAVKFFEHEENKKINEDRRKARDGEEILKSHMGRNEASAIEYLELRLSGIKNIDPSLRSYLRAEGLRNIKICFSKIQGNIK